jgi:hypothetical protein
MTYRPTYLRQKQFGLGWIFDKGINITRDSSLIRRNLIHRQMIHIFTNQKAHIQYGMDVTYLKQMFWLKFSISVGK